MTPTVGSVVLFKTRLASLKFNQSTEEVAVHPAIVTRVHNAAMLDLTVIFNGSVPAPKNLVVNVDERGSWWEWPEKV
jgi:hypothetical protein